MNRIKVNSINEARDELAYRKKNLPGFIHTVLRKNNGMTIESMPISLYIDNVTNTMIQKGYSQSVYAKPRR